MEVTRRFEAIAHALQLALGHHQAGRLEEAEQLCRKVLGEQPQNPGALHILSVIALQFRRYEEAANFVEKALRTEAPRPDLLINLGAAYRGLGRTAEAERCYRAALTLDPDFAEGHNNLGNVLREIGRPQDAEECFRRALTLNPAYLQAHFNLGDTLLERRRLAQAEECFRSALRIHPASYQAHHYLGVVLGARGRLGEAERCFREALTLNPDYPEALNGLGLAMQGLGRLAEAEQSLRRVLTLQPDHAQAHHNLGLVLNDLGRLEESEQSMRQALALRPGYAEAHSNLGSVLMALGNIEEAEQCFRQALRLEPDFVMAHSNLIFVLDLVEAVGVKVQQQERRRWYEQHARKYAGTIRQHANSRDAARRLRIGYVSADFRRHSAYYQISPVLRRHDRTAFEVFCYSGVTREDNATVELKAAVDGWRSTVAVEDEALAEQIRCDGIDILVDLSGHSAGNRLLAFARKPAPVQVSAWGYCTGTGLATMDYLLLDPIVAPESSRSHFAEEIVDLPCWTSYEPPPYMPDVSPLPALASGPFTFGYINRIEKITDRVLALWGQIVAAVPSSRLLLKHRGLDEPKPKDKLLRRLANAGIAPERVQLLGFTAHAEHLKIYHEIDLGLDPYPQGGGMSTAEALWMGVPVVTLCGATIPSRISASLMSALKMRKWIARSENEYIRIAAGATRDLPSLARQRAALRPRMAKSIIGDTGRYTRAVEAAYRSMWRRWCAARKAP